MDDREIVEQYVEVLLDQETHAETLEHRSPSTRCVVQRYYTRSWPMNNGGLIWLGLHFDKSKSQRMNREADG